jgi:fatty-acid desaturase
MNIKIKSVIYGAFAIIIVLLLNLIVLALLDFPQMPLEIIKKYFILLVLLIGGFGFQVGLFTYFKHINSLTCSTTVASGGIATVSMILCCSHYLLNALPFLGAIVGISALTTLSKYTLHFILLGIFSNIIGIGIMFYQYRKHRRKSEK